ncbi:MAG: hypothetical protein Q7S10_00015 [bacterium]|nr:hypothetical protein [bacterium]
MNKLKYLILPLMALLGITSVAFALHSPTHYSFFGEASYLEPAGNGSTRGVHLTSDSSPGFAGIDYGIESGTTFADISTLSTDYRFESDDSCAGGSPRFQVELASPDNSDTGNVFVYLGPPPSYTNCPSGVWLNTGDLLEGANPVDTSQLNGGTFYDPYAAALTKYGSYTVTGIQLVADASWAFVDGEQAFDVDNTLIDATLFTYERPVPTHKDECENDGWRELGRPDGSGFSDKEACRKFVKRGI